jgi:hypothetical protein
MIYMLMADGTTSEFPEAASAEVDSGHLILKCPQGNLVHTIEARLVAAYGSVEAHFKDYSRPSTTNN